MSPPDTSPSLMARKTAAAPPFRVNPQSPSPAIVSILVISGSAWMMALQALSMAETKAEGSGASMGGIDLSVDETVFDVLDEKTSPAGGTREDHFQPGVSVGSSRSERIKSLVFFSSGRSRRVIENPGMFKLVFIVVGGGQSMDHYQTIPRHTMKVPEMSL